MKKILSSLFISGMMFLSIAAFGPATAYAARYSGKVFNITPPDNRPCLFFTVTGAPGFLAVRKSHGGFKEVWSLLLLARATGASLSVITTGNGIGACSNFEEATNVWMP